MPSLLIVFIIFVCMLCGMLLGSYLRLVLPEHHTQADSKDILITSAGMMATLIALIIGLLVSSANDSFNTTRASITQAGAKMITLDYYLSRYGPEAEVDRKFLRQAVASSIERIWPDESAQGTKLAKLEAGNGTADVYNKIRELLPKNDAQKYLQTQALQLSADVMQSRWMLIEQSQTQLPMVFLIVLTFWLTVLFVQFGLLAPRNITAITSLLICTISISGAIFIILELNQPLEGLIKISSAPLHKALSLIGQ